MRWYRSWPRSGQCRAKGRAHIIDNLPRLVMTDCDYSTVEGGFPEDEPGFCLIEWDIGVGRRERDLFEEIALRQPNRVLVAPYDIYPEGQAPSLVHKFCPDPSKPGIRYPAIRANPVQPTGEVHSFGFGCIYLPQHVLRTWPSGKVMRDSTFSDWHMMHFGTARIAWDVHPQHLHGD